MNDLERAIEALESVQQTAEAVLKELRTVPLGEGDPTYGKWRAWLRDTARVHNASGNAMAQLLQAALSQAELEVKLSTEYVNQVCGQLTDRETKEAASAKLPDER